MLPTISVSTAIDWLGASLYERFAVSGPTLRITRSGYATSAPGYWERYTDKTLAATLRAPGIPEAGTRLFMGDQSIPIHQLGSRFHFAGVAGPVVNITTRAGTRWLKVDRASAGGSSIGECSTWNMATSTRGNGIVGF